MLTDQQQFVLDRDARNRLTEANSIIREQLAAGMSLDVIAKPLGGHDGIDPREILASMAVAENYQIRPGQAMAMLPSLMKFTHGEKFDLDEVVKSYYAKPADFELPFVHKNMKEFQAQLQKEEEKGKVPEEKRPRPPLEAFDFSWGGFNQGYLINRAVQRQVADKMWFNNDPSEEEFVKGMLKAETDGEKEQLREKRLNDIVSEQIGRIQKLRDLEGRMEQLKKEPPGLWLSKFNAWSRGVGRVRMAGYDAAAEATNILGKAFDSGRVKDVSDNLNLMSRSYWRAMQSAELSSISHGTLDEMTNAFLENAPYFGTAIAAAIFSPDKLTPAVMFFMAAGVEGSMIKQQALDAGFSERSASMRGWLGGSINGLIEAAGGGGAKYTPKKLSARLAQYPGIFTKNALREIFMEELPQEVVSMALSGDVPYTRTGEIDWDEVTERFITLARDTAFCSTLFTAGSSAIGEYSNWRRERIVSQESAEAMSMAIEFILSEAGSQRSFFPFFQRKQPQIKEVKKEAAAPAEVKAVERLDDVTPNEVLDTPEINDLLDQTPPYGLAQRLDEKGQPMDEWAVTDWDTQKEIKTGLTKKEAVKLMEKLNSGLEQPPRSRVRDILPSSQDIETLTHTQLMQAVFKKVSQQSRKIVAEVTRDIIATKKEIVEYAKQALDNLDITEGQRNSLLNKVAKAVTDKDKTNAIATIETIREAQRHKEAEGEFKKLRRFFTRASKRRVSDGGIHYAVHDVLRDLLDNYTSLSPKILNTIKRAEAYLDRIREDVGGEYSAAYAEAMIPKAIVGKLRDLAARRIADMSADELVELNETIKHYLKLNQLWSKLTANRKHREMRQFLDNAVGTVKLKEKPGRTKRFRPKRGFFARVYDGFLGLKNDDIHTIANSIWGKFNPISRMVMETRRRQLSYALKYQDMLQDLMEKSGITVDHLKRWSIHGSILPIKERIKQKIGLGVDLHDATVAGQHRQFTMGELMSFVLHSRNDYNTRRVVRNGIAFLDVGEMGKLTPEEYSHLIGIVENDATAKAFVDGLAQFYIESARDINELSRKLDGRDLATVDNYFHIEYVKEGGVVGTEYVRDSIMDEEGRLKPRTSSNRAVVIRDVFEVLNEDIPVISNFVGLAEGIRKLRSLANYGPFRERLNKARAEHIKNELDERIRAMQLSRQRPTGTLDRAISRLGRGTARAVLTVPIIWAYQPFSAAFYATESSAKYMRAIRMRLGRGFVRDLTENWTLYRARKEGVGASKSIGMIVNIRKLLTGKNNIVDSQLAGLHMGDLWGVTRAAQIVRAEMADQNLSGESLEWWRNYGVEPSSLKYGTPEYWAAFNDRADHLVTLTQPMFFPESKGEYASSDSAIIREMARFRSFIDQVGRIMRRQISMAEKGDVSKSRAMWNMGLVLTVMSVTKPILRYLWDRFALGREKELDDLLAEILTQPFAIIPFVGYPISRIAKEALGERSYFAPEYSVMPMVIVDGVLKHAWETAKGIGYTFDDEYFRTGPHRGELKSDVYFKRGVKGLFEDYLMFHGVPVAELEKAEWFKD